MPSQALCGLFFLDNKEEKAQSLSEHDSVCLKRRLVFLSQTLLQRGRHCNVLQRFATFCSEHLLNSKSESRSRKIKTHEYKISTKKKKKSLARAQGLCRRATMLGRVGRTRRGPGREQLEKTPLDSFVP